MRTNFFKFTREVGFILVFFITGLLSVEAQTTPLPGHIKGCGPNGGGTIVGHVGYHYSLNCPWCCNFINDMAHSCNYPICDNTEPGPCPQCVEIKPDVGLDHSVITIFSLGRSFKVLTSSIVITDNGSNGTNIEFDCYDCP